MYIIPDILVTKWVERGQPRIINCAFDKVNMQAIALMTEDIGLISIWGPW